MIRLIVAADEPALFFRSVSEAESYLEWIDVRDGIYTAAFGRAGEVYSVSEDGRFVRIEIADSAPRPGELRELLTRFLGGVGVRVEPDETLDQLLERCEQYVVCT